jgi:hypothetical protein
MDFEVLNSIYSGIVEFFKIVAVEKIIFPDKL